MIFTPEHCEKILRGEKTQTRRVVKAGEHLNQWLDGRGFNVYTEYHRGIPLPHNMAVKRRVKWQVGNTYAIQPGRGKKGIGRIRITSIDREQLHDINAVDCWAEGCEKSGWRDDFIRRWDSINTRPGTRWDSNPDVWVLTFEVAA